MLDKLIAAALTRPSMAHRALREEIERLRAGGYLSETELEELARDAASRLSERLTEARTAVAPLVVGLGDSVRAALDVPSRSEILALTEELRRARGERGAAPQAPPAEPTDGAARDD